MNAGNDNGDLFQNSDLFQILLVEDNPDDQHLLHLALQDTGLSYELHWVPGSEEAWAALEEKSWDVALVDYYLIGETGVELIQRARGAGYQTPFILLTGSQDPKTNEEALKAGATDYLLKEWLTPRDLQRALQYALERGRSERLLHETRQFLQSSFDALAANIAVLDSQSNIIAVNDGWKRFADENDFSGDGYGRGQNYLDLCRRAQAEGDLYALHAGEGITEVLLGQRNRFTLEYPCHSPEAKRWFLLRVTRFIQREQTYLVVAHEDITTAVLATKVIQENEALLRTVVSTADIVISAIDQKGVFTMSVGGGLQAAGIRAGEAVGQSVWERYAHMPDVLDAVHRVLSGQNASLTAKVGERFFESRYTPLRNAEGEVVGAVNVALDVTERKQNEEALRRSETELKISEAELRASEAELRALLGVMRDAILEIDRNGRYLKVVATRTDQLILPPEQMQGSTLHDTLPQQQADEFLGHVRRALKSGHAVEIEYPISIRGVERWFSASVLPLTEHSVVWKARDITPLKRAMAALQEAEANYRSIFENAVEGIYQMTPEGRITSANPALARLLGFESPQELLEHSGDHARQLYVEWADFQEFLHAVNEAGVIADFEIQMHRKDDMVIWVAQSARALHDDAGTICCYEGSMVDITRRKEAEFQLHVDAFFDKLTRLPNRALFLDRLTHLLEIIRRNEDKRFAVLFLDVDSFKYINDSMGHAAGDEFLIHVTERLVKALRSGDTVARLGGDEFTILLPNIEDTSEAIQIAERILQEIKTPLQIEGNEVYATASIGIAYGGAHYQSAQDVLRDADAAMYRAKARGRGRYEIFDTSMQKQALQRLRLESRLRRALQQGDIIAYYQPIIELQTGRLHGFEALARWQDGTQGLIPPGEFIPVAEETNLIVDVDERVREVAFGQIREWEARWPGHCPLSISVNVSSRFFSVVDLAAQVEESIGRINLLPRNVNLEITETALMHNVELAQATFKRLKELGVCLSLDDFGTGYSSLSHLHRFPVDVLKIDRSFVSRLGSPELPEEIVRTIINLAHLLHMAVVAEGVETIEQAQWLRGAGCKYAQGFFFAKPLSPEEATRLLEGGKRWALM